MLLLIGDDAISLTGWWNDNGSQFRTPSLEIIIRRMYRVGFARLAVDRAFRGGSATALLEDYELLRLREAPGWDGRGQPSEVVGIGTITTPWCYQSHIWPTLNVRMICAPPYLGLLEWSLPRYLCGTEQGQDHGLG